MTANSCIETIRNLPQASANVHMQRLCGISHFFEDGYDFHSIIHSPAIVREDKEEYGDWQTNQDLALSICHLLKKQGIRPQVIKEPTCGKGHFILAALQTFDNIEEIYGIEIYKPYLQTLKLDILQHYLDHPQASKSTIHLLHRNFFDFDFQPIKTSFKGKDILVIGNPPWVTNSKLGEIQSNNLPPKSNFKKAKGLEAITGKGNFDIAEYICIQMIKLLSGEQAHLALLLKNSVIKNIVAGQNQEQFPIRRIEQYNIDAKREFGATVAASLLHLTMGDNGAQRCQVNDFYTSTPSHEYGWVNGCFVADVSSYEQYKYIDGTSPLKWWSGVKHDCAKIMELTLQDGKWVNGFGQVADIEDTAVYPLIKSSDIKKDKTSTSRKFIIITQKSTSEETEWLKSKCPKTYQYLIENAELLDKRGSSIYRNRPRFCLFGIGKYSFKRYKVVVSGLYKHTYFTLVESPNGKPMMLDDTCYSLGFDEYDNAFAAQCLLNSIPIQAFIRSLLFSDAKRVINKDLLMRIDLLKAAQHLKGKDIGLNESIWNRFISFLKLNAIPKQHSLF